MKPITAFGLVSALLLLSVSTFLVVKQNSTDVLTQQDFDNNFYCLRLSYKFIPFSYLNFYFLKNHCQEPKRFQIVYIDLNSESKEQKEYSSSCLSHKQKEKSTVYQMNIMINEIKEFDC